MTRLNSRLGFAAVALGLSSGCADLTEPGPSAGQERPSTRSTAAQAAAVPAAPAPAAPANPAGAQEKIKASHVLISYKGGARSKATRTKEEAKKLATAVLARAKAGEDFGNLARKHSDGPSANKRGELGEFGRGNMVKPFADAAFALKPGEISPIVETEFGFHVIRRAE